MPRRRAGDLGSLIEDRRGNVSIEMTFLATLRPVPVIGAYHFGRLAMEQSTMTQTARIEAHWTLNNGSGDTLQVPPDHRNTFPLCKAMGLDPSTLQGESSMVVH